MTGQSLSHPSNNIWEHNLRHCLGNVVLCGWLFQFVRAQTRAHTLACSTAARFPSQPPCQKDMVARRMEGALEHNWHSCLSADPDRAHGTVQGDGTTQLAARARSRAGWGTTDSAWEHDDETALSRDESSFKILLTLKSPFPLEDS